MERPKILHEAMRYAVLLGGKRIRPILTLAACEAVGGKEKEAIAAACAIELIHSYSLIHDDLPCMDDDDTRRGMPSCHKKFGETTALLAGDALLTLAFRILADSSSKNHKNQIQVARWIADAAGSLGMIGGQVVDCQAQGSEIDIPTIDYINTHKTGSLIAVACRTGAILGGGSKKQVEFLYGYGKCVGLLFQIVDDILDSEGYAKLVGIPEARQEAGKLNRRAKETLKIFGKKGEPLERMADFLLQRTA